MTSYSEPMAEWLRNPDAEVFIAAKLADFVGMMSPALKLESDMIRFTSSRLIDWVDHLVLADGVALRGQLAGLGFLLEEVTSEPGDVVFHHPGALFPSLLLRSGTDARPGQTLGVAIHVEDAGEFLMTHHVAAEIEGTPFGPFRRALVWRVEGRELWVVERRGHTGFLPVVMPPDYPQRYISAQERWATRPREFDDARDGMAQTLSLARTLVAEIGRDAAAWIAFAAERAHWQRRNLAGQVQKSRQDRLGLGWANHDHHTFRSSREVFSELIQILETFGFNPRERFYAGAEAGWGAQVLEQRACRFAVFADADLAPDEVEGDFAHRPLSPRKRLGTVGLWCGLHGESMLSAGLHHLAGRFDFETLTSDLAERAVPMMQPFSAFSYLRQAFTRGERWDVSKERLERMAAKGQIDRAQLERFSQQGAVGSHLENIQRGEGFKGFNQQTISDIIRRTDPRLE